MSKKTLAQIGLLSINVLLTSILTTIFQILGGRVEGPAYVVVPYFIIIIASQHFFMNELTKLDKKEDENE